MLKDCLLIIFYTFFKYFSVRNIGLYHLYISSSSINNSYVQVIKTNIKTNFKPDFMLK